MGRIFPAVTAESVVRDAHKWRNFWSTTEAAWFYLCAPTPRSVGQKSAVAYRAPTPRSVGHKSTVACWAPTSFLASCLVRRARTNGSSRPSGVIRCKPDGYTREESGDVLLGAHPLYLNCTRFGDTAIEVLWSSRA